MDPWFPRPGSCKSPRGLQYIFANISWKLDENENKIRREGRVTSFTPLDPKDLKYPDCLEFSFEGWKRIQFNNWCIFSNYSVLRFESMVFCEEPLTLAKTISYYANRLEVTVGEKKYTAMFVMIRTLNNSGFDWKSEWASCPVILIRFGSFYFYL